MTKSITIGLDVDSTSFERKMSEIENRIKRMREFGPSGTYSQLSQQYKDSGQTQKSQKMDEYRQRSASQGRKQLQQDLRANEGLIKKNEMAQERVLNSMNKVLKVQENINRAKEMGTKLDEKHAELVQSTSNIKSQLSGQGMGPFSGQNLRDMQAANLRGGGGFRGGMRGLGVAGQAAMKSPSMIAAGLGMVGKAVETGGQFAKQIMTYPERIAKREATTAGMLSETARLQEQRRGYEMSYYSPERMKALDMASTRVSAEKMTDKTDLLGSTLKGASVGAGIGATAGTYLSVATAGLATPLIAPMAAAGGLVGGAVSFGSSMFNDRKRNMVSGMLGDKEGKANYEKEMDAVFSGKYQEQLKIGKEKSYEKRMAASFLEKNSQRFRGLQRSMGLSDKELFQGDESIFVKAGRAGYNMDTMTQNMQGIMAGGGRGSVAAAGGQVTAQMQRNMNLTNAPQLLGKVSGISGGGVDESKDAIIRMFAEATRLGLDDSEVRGFLQTSAEIASQSGSSTDVISQLLGAGVGDLKTGRGIQAAATALDSIRKQTSQMGGLTGQYQLAELADVKVTGRDGKERSLTLGEKAYISGTDIAKLDPESDFIKSLTPGQSKGEREAFVKDLRKKKARAARRSPEQEKALDELNKAEKAMEQANTGDPLSEENDMFSEEAMEKRKKAELDLIDAKKEAKAAFALVNGNFAGLGLKEQDAELDILRKVKSGEYSEADATKARERYQTAAGGAVNEKEISGAKDDVGQLKRLEKHIGPLTEAFKLNTEKSEALGIAMDSLATRLKDDKGDSGDKAELRKEFTELIKSIREQTTGSTAPVPEKVKGDTNHGKAQ